MRNREYNFGGDSPARLDENPETWPNICLRLDLSRSYRPPMNHSPFISNTAGVDEATETGMAKRVFARELSIFPQWVLFGKVHEGTRWTGSGRSIEEVPLPWRQRNLDWNRFPRTGVITY